jgi:hypothetical protein
MSHHNAIATIGALCLLAVIAPDPPAAAFTEVVDATDLPPGQTTSGDPLASISGTFAALGDVDVYRIAITDAASFEAVTSASAGTDTVLFLFDASGLPVAGNDDITGGGSADQYFSRLAGIPGLANGTYLLSISRWPWFPSSAGGPMYTTDAGTEVLVPDQGVAYPTGPGGGEVLESWAPAFASNDPLQPPYSIALIGVPEPSRRAGIAAALAGLAAIGFARRAPAAC